MGKAVLSSAIIIMPREVIDRPSRSGGRKEVDAVQVLPPAVAVGQVLSRFLPAVSHGRCMPADRVHPQAVGVEDQSSQKQALESRKLRTSPRAKVEHARCPIAAISPRRRSAMIRSRAGAVEAVQADLILGEVAGTQSKITPIPA